MNTNSDDKGQKCGLNSISNASSRGNVAWSSTTAFLLQSACITDHVSNSCSYQLCDKLEKVAGLQMTLCIVLLFHYLTVLHKISSKDADQQELKGQNTKRESRVSSLRMAVTAAASKGNCPAASRES